MIGKLLGAALVLWGLADLYMDKQGGNLWALVGLQLPEPLATYSPYIALFAGAVIFVVFGRKRSPDRI